MLFILFLTPIQCSIAVVIASKCLNAFIVASSQLPRSLPPTPPHLSGGWLPHSFSFFQVVVVAAACPTCVVVIDLSLMGGSRCRLRLPQRREMREREREGGLQAEAAAGAASACAAATCAWPRNY